MQKEFFLEIGTEELPSGFLNQVRSELPGHFRKILKSERIGFTGLHLFYTPRRIAIYIEDLASRQDITFKEIVGPPAKIGFDRKGKHTEAAIGFAKSNNVSLAALSVTSTPKGEYLCIKEEMESVETAFLLGRILPVLIKGISAKKTMKWDDSGFRFTRPVRWLLALYNGNTVDFTVGLLRSGDITFGHRKKRTSHKVISFADYRNWLLENDVILDQNAREAKIRDEIKLLLHQKLSADLMPDMGTDGGIDAELVTDAVNMTEYPTALVGGFSAEYLKLPSEVLVTSMKKHQGFFSVYDKNCELHPCFISIVDMHGHKNGDLDLVGSGNEKVLRSRLEDARFFYSEDLKTTMYKQVESLGKIMFQQKLGTVYDKVLRIQKIIRVFAPHIALTEAEEEKAFRSALLSKSDLVTEMVGEFPSLQGIMGREYALLDGEDAEVASAIGEQYLPRFFGDTMPASRLGAILSIADKVDTITGCFSAGIVPTGSQDPYALRRQALAVVCILIDQKMDIDINRLTADVLAIFSGAVEHDKVEMEKDICDFYRTRVEHYLYSNEVRYDILNAVMSIHSNVPYRAVVIALSLNMLSLRDEFSNLLLSIKRIFNIIPSSEFAIAPELFNKEEKALYNAAVELSLLVEKHFAKGQYAESVESLATMIDPITTFFDKVLIMCENQKERENRLALLQFISKIFIKIADFSNIVAKQIPRSPAQ